MGSVADKVVHASKIPVWLVRAGIPEEIVYDKWPTRTILVPLDGSELAESVLPHVEALAKQRGAELVDVVLLRVCEGATSMPTGQARLMYYEHRVTVDQDEHLEQKMAQRKREAEDYLAGVEKRLTDAGLRVRSEVLWGNPTDEIVVYADRNPFNLIVMATHARSGLSRWAMGSVADRVVRGVSRPILLVRPR
jgi:nucleotide-binding universal stress UspA family protein